VKLEYFMGQSDAGKACSPQSESHTDTSLILVSWCSSPVNWKKLRL